MRVLDRGLCLATAWALGASCAQTPRIPVASTRTAAIEKPAPVVVIDPPKTDDVVVVSIQAQALEILNRNCGVCHSAGNAQGNFGTIANVEEMIATGRYIVPGSPEKSILITKLAPTGNMPPAGALKPEEILLLNDWVKGLKAATIVPLVEADAINLVRKDLEANVPAGQRAGVRYFSLHVPQNLGATAATLGMLRQAFVKVLNSISRAPVIVQPKAVDKDRLIYRVQLSDLGLIEANFERVMNNFYPFAQTFVPVGDNALARRAADDHQFLRASLGTECYMIRADWFAATAALPALYSDLVQLGADQQALQAQLGVTQIQNILDNKVVRSGFKNSNVSSQNRIVERHVQSNGLGYWLSYDFAGEEGPANIFGSPLGPVGIGQDPKAFLHDGGEMIFQLPNGLFGYYLANAAGVKIDKGPTSIVRQGDAPAQFVSAIVNGVSCMSCHGAGLLYKADEVRAFANASVGNFTAAQLDKVRSLFVEEKTFKELFDKDNALYFKSLSTLGISPALPDPVSQAYRYYNRGLSRVDVREELGLPEADFARMMTVEPFRTQWSSLNSSQGYIKRDELQNHLQEALDIHKLSAQPINPRIGDAVITPQCMFADPLRMGGCLLRVPPPPPAAALTGRE